MSRILFVDDEKNVLEAYKRAFYNKYDFVMIDSGAAAIDLINNSEPFQVIITDYKMPGMNGVELLNLVRNLSPDTIQIMLTGQADMQAIIDLINKGNIYRFLTKPCAQEDMITSIDSAIRMYELAAAEKELLGKTLGGSIKVLADLLALAKPQAFNKTQKIRSLAKSIYSELVIDGKWQIEIAATLSQIGCVTIPDDILKKVYKGLTLSQSENVMFARHSSIGADMISKIPRLEKVAEIIRYQEKNYDGTGYPADDVNEELIPEGSRILKIALDYDKAVTSGVEGDKALYDMSKKTGVYDPFLLSIAGTKFTKINSPSQQYLKEELSGDNLKEEMYLSEDLVTATGVTIGARNQKLTQALIATIINYQENNQLKDKIKVVSIIG